MVNVLFIVKSPSNCKMNTKENKITTTNIKQTSNFNYQNIYLNSKRNFLFKSRWRTSKLAPSPNKLSEFVPATITTASRRWRSTIAVISHFRNKQQKYLWLMILLLATLIEHAMPLDVTTGTYGVRRIGVVTDLSRQSQFKHGLINMHDGPQNVNNSKQLSRVAFVPSGQFPVFRQFDTNLRAAVPAERISHQHGNNKMASSLNSPSTPAYATQKMNGNPKPSEEAIQIQEDILNFQANLNNFPYREQPRKIEHHRTGSRRAPEQQQRVTSYKRGVEQNKTIQQNDMRSDMKDLNDLLAEYLTNFFEKGEYHPTSDLLLELQKQHNQSVPTNENDKPRSTRQATVAVPDAKLITDLPRTLQSGRLLFLTGLKKVLWPVFVGLQILKSLLIAMFIPAIIGSFTKLLGKGISTGSAPLLIRPMDPPQELDFRDNSLSFDEDKFSMTDEGLKDNMPYKYNHPDASQLHNEYVFDPSSVNNHLSYTRLGMNERQHQQMQDSYMSALQSIGSASFKNSGSLSSSSSGLLAPMAKRPPPAANVNTFQQFQNVPDSSLLLSNYDPFYSPLLSRLDSVFAQLKLNSDKEACREKLICLMYANPAKYAPYSNLVSAQLSRELNELRKPTSDNPDILRFFKYMRAAKDGQDGIDCEKTFDKCTEFKDFDNPAMVSTYHDINKLVQARKYNGK